MPTTTLPQSKEKAAEISRKITNSRPLKRDKDAPEQQVTGGFNRRRIGRSPTRTAPPRATVNEPDHARRPLAAIGLVDGVFERDDPQQIALSLKRSAERSHRRKSEPYQSAMSMLTFYINRAGSNLSAERKTVLEAAKDELRKAFGRED